MTEVHQVCYAVNNAALLAGQVLCHDIPLLCEHECAETLLDVEEQRAVVVFFSPRALALLKARSIKRDVPDIIKRSRLCRNFCVLAGRSVRVVDLPARCLGVRCRPNELRIDRQTSIPGAVLDVFILTCKDLMLIACWTLHPSS